MRINLSNQSKFENRHNAPDTEDVRQMLKVIGVDTLDTLINQTVPDKIRLKKPLTLPKPQNEYEFLKNIKKLALRNKVFKSYIGIGYHDTIVPAVILRNIMENPGWYTAYTPYQAEIAQGRLEMLLNFQSVVIDLTGMEIANASLLDEATAAAEAMHLLHAQKPSSKISSNTFFVADNVHPQTIDLLKTRSAPIGVDILIAKYDSIDFLNENIYGILLQYPASDGSVEDYTNIIQKAHENNILVAVAADLLSLTVLTPPGEMGADVVVGSSQRFGVPLGYGGPHAAFFATREAFKRNIPGRLIGVSIDADGNKALRMALQTREQHIRREKATSNICTAQVLLSVMAAAYAIYHGPEGLKNIGLRTHGLTRLLAKGLEKLGFNVLTKTFFDTITISINDNDDIRKMAEGNQINFRYANDKTIGISLNETTTVEDVEDIIEIFAQCSNIKVEFNIQDLAADIELQLPESLKRKSTYLSHPVFNTHHSEHEMLRYLKFLENKDLSMVHSMIALGSCTMKLNATAEMIPVTWSEIGGIHPFAPIEQTGGYQELFTNLEAWLCEITGFAAVSLQPNSGAQGEYAGLLVIRAYHQSRGDFDRDISLIPSSAHGTNPASAVMAGMQVVVVRCDENGNIDVPDLKSKAEQYKERLSCLMVTYPSTHGVFEEGINDICDIIHANGGQVYMDGANMNAQVGLTSPANIGADVCHLNLHKTFCIPHGGGGPGMGPIGVAAHLAPFLPGHSLVETGGEKATSAVSAAPWGSASILPISYAYISMMGVEGLTNATKIAILNANYIKARLEKHFPILYTNHNSRCAHEMILDCRNFKAFGIEVEDIAKRLMDYGFHAPTVSFPVAGTLMVEPTESEPKAEIDRFCEAMISIRKEIDEIENGIADKQNNVLKRAPHTVNTITSDHWDRPYSRQKAAYPLAFVKEKKFWPAVSRIDSAYGDRNLICACEPVESYAEEVVA